MEPATTRRARDLPVTAKTEEGIRILFSKSESKLLRRLHGEKQLTRDRRFAKKVLSISIQSTRQSKLRKV
jgi:hypothetical protein